MQFIVWKNQNCDAKEGGVPLREKRTYFSDGEVPTAIKLEGGGVKALMALPLKKTYLFGFHFI